MPHLIKSRYIVRARIRWFGEKHQAPVNKMVCWPVRFRGHEAEWPHTSWSLVIDFQRPWDSSMATIADVAFLAPDAPHELLSPGRMFDFFDGDDGAEGTVLGQA